MLIHDDLNLAKTGTQKTTALTAIIITANESNQHCAPGVPTQTTDFRRTPHEKSFGHNHCWDCSRRFLLTQHLRSGTFMFMIDRSQVWCTTHGIALFRYWFEAFGPNDIVPYRSLFPLGTDHRLSYMSETTGEYDTVSLWRLCHISASCVPRLLS